MERTGLNNLFRHHWSRGWRAVCRLPVPKNELPPVEKLSHRVSPAAIILTWSKVQPRKLTLNGETWRLLKSLFIPSTSLVSHIFQTGWSLGIVGQVLRELWIDPRRFTKRSSMQRENNEGMNIQAHSVLLYASSDEWFLPSRNTIDCEARRM